ncbi:MAG: hypothetical protein Q4P13_13190 [Psychrobacter sp.]|nr:hypothetical protein [Psychrobacter sp.]
MTSKLNRLIIDYQSKVAYGIDLFRQKIGDEYPLNAWGRKALPQKGFLNKNTKYSFHGIGCLLEFPNCEVDFDYGPQKRYDGFDLWRLRIYWESCKDDYGYASYDEIVVDFKQAIKKDEIVTMEGTTLYFFKEF